MRYANKSAIWDALIVLLILLEAALILWLPHELLPQGINEVCYTLCSLLIGAAVLLRYWNAEPTYRSYAGKPVPALLRVAPLLLLIPCLACTAPLFAAAFRETPIGEASDIIPTIVLAVRRLLGGETVYKTIDEWGYRLPLTYLPMQWLPYTPAEVLRFDYRWIAVGIYYLATAVIAFRCSRVAPFRGIVAALLSQYLVWMVLKHDAGIASVTVELMVAGYYMLLVAGLSGSSPLLRGAAIALCLLSRYSLVLWLPLWAAVEWLAVDKKGFYRSAIAIAVLVLGIYIIPFLSQDWGAFLRGYRYYTEAALGEWSRLEGNGVPYQLNRGVGFARLFYLKLWHYSVADRLRSLQKVHFALCLGSTLFMGAGYFLLRRRPHPRIFLLASFKIYLSLFLAFIQVPYTYLMITAVSVSIAIFAELARWRVDTHQPNT